MKNEVLKIVDKSRMLLNCIQYVQNAFIIGYAHSTTTHLCSYEEVTYFINI